MRYNGLVVKKQDNKCTDISFKVEYSGPDYGSVITKKDYQKLAKATNKMKGVSLYKTRYGGLRVTFFGNKELDKFYLKQTDGSLVSLEEYINLCFMMGYVEDNKHYKLIENNDYINNTELSIMIYSNRIMFIVRKR